MYRIDIFNNLSSFAGTIVTTIRHIRRCFSFNKNGRYNDICEHVAESDDDIFRETNRNIVSI